MFLIFASELAACLGSNPYQRSREAIIKIWKRSYPVVFRDAISRTNAKEDLSIYQIVDELDLQEELDVIVNSGGDMDISILLQDIVDRLKLDEEKTRAICSYVYTQRGQRAEKTILDRTEQGLDTKIEKRNDIFYKRYIPYHSHI